MDKQETLAWALARCNDLVNEHLEAHYADWNDVDKPDLISRWNESEYGFAFILCLRKTGSDTIIIDRDRQIDSVAADVNRGIIGLANDKFYIINPYFKQIDEVSSLRAFTLCMYQFRDKYSSLQFESNGSVTIIY